MMRPSAMWLTALAVLAVAVPTVAPPVLPNEPQDNHRRANEESLNDREQKLDVEYDFYLKEVVQLLETDPTFRQKLENASMDDIKSGKISEELHFVDRNIRTKLDELKRMELDRLQNMARREYELTQGGRRGPRMPHPAHLDIRNPHTFEVKDLKRLMKQTTKDLEELDRRRREEFKQYEMRKEHNRRESLKAMDEEHRRKAQAEYDEQQRKHKDHPKLHHPGSKQQLEEVWKEEDHMEEQDFNPQTFFAMHDLNGDSHWDEDELEALFRAELKKMYEKGAPEDDMTERIEEMNRMREHVINETDVDRDGRISFNEFIDMTRKQEFNQDPGWQGLDEQQMYNDQEYQEYERHLMEQQNMIPQDGRQHHYPPQGGVPMGAPYHNQEFQGGPQFQQYPPQGVPPPHQQQQQYYQQQQGMPPPHQQQQQYYQQQGVPPGQQQYQQQQAPYQQQQQFQQQQYQQYPQGVPQQQQQQQFQQPPQGIPQSQQPTAPQQHVPVQQGAPHSLGGTASREPEHDPPKVAAPAAPEAVKPPVAPEAVKSPPETNDLPAPAAPQKTV